MGTSVSNSCHTLNPILQTGSRSRIKISNNILILIVHILKKPWKHTHRKKLNNNPQRILAIVFIIMMFYNRWILILTQNSSKMVLKIPAIVIPAEIIWIKISVRTILSTVVIGNLCTQSKLNLLNYLKKPRSKLLVKHIHISNLVKSSSLNEPALALISERLTISRKSIIISMLQKLHTIILIFNNKPFRF